jgi:hypothetical protein
MHRASKVRGNWRKFHDEKIGSYCDDEKLLSVAFRCARASKLHDASAAKVQQAQVGVLSMVGWWLGMSPSPRGAHEFVTSGPCTCLACFLIATSW